MRNPEVAVLALRAAEMRQYCANAFRKMTSETAAALPQTQRTRKFHLRFQFSPSPKSVSEFTINRLQGGRQWLRDKSNPFQVTRE